MELHYVLKLQWKQKCWHAIVAWQSRYKPVMQAWPKVLSLLATLLLQNNNFMKGTSHSVHKKKGVFLQIKHAQNPGHNNQVTRQCDGVRPWEWQWRKNEESPVRMNSYEEQVLEPNEGRHVWYFNTWCKDISRNCLQYFKSKLSGRSPVKMNSYDKHVLESNKESGVWYFNKTFKDIFRICLQYLPSVFQNKMSGRNPVRMNSYDKQLLEPNKESGVWYFNITDKDIFSICLQYLPSVFQK